MGRKERGRGGGGGRGGAGTGVQGEGTQKETTEKKKEKVVGEEDECTGVKGMLDRSTKRNATQEKARKEAVQQPHH